MQQYNQEITDLNQPVLVSQTKRKRGPGGVMPGPAVLIPELCYLTGIVSVVIHTESSTVYVVYFGIIATLTDLLTGILACINKFGKDTCKCCNYT